MIDLIFQITPTGEIANKKKMAGFFAGISPGTYLLTVKPKKARSLSQNAFYWAVCVPMVLDGLRDIGYDEIKTKEQAHDILKDRFLRRTIGGDDQRAPLEYTLSTTNLTTVEFNEYIAEIQKFAVEFLNIIIPDPGQKLEIDF